MKSFSLIIFCLFIASTQGQNYPIIDTGLQEYFSNTSVIDAPTSKDPFYGQDAHYQGLKASYSQNNNGTITDNHTGLMWQKNMGEKITFSDAQVKADTLQLGGYDDWRIPSIKELYSLIQFTGQVKGAKSIKLFIDTIFFDQALGNPDIGEREIDAQTWSATHYCSTTMKNDTTVFGVNFIDGRIKGYPKYTPNSNNTIPRKMYFRLVRGNKDYGNNEFIDNNDGTVSDLSTGLMWQKSDDGTRRDWEESLRYAEQLTLAQHNDWRLPNAKELHSIVDYSRSPSITNSPSINPVFTCTEIEDPSGSWGQYPYYWTSTTHLDGNNPYANAAYFAFGQAQGIMNNTLLDVHGAGSQRSDPKSGNINEYPKYQGPQGDVRYVYNYVRCVRDINIEDDLKNTNTSKESLHPNPVPRGKPLLIRVNNNKKQSITIYKIDGTILCSFEAKAINNIIKIDTSSLERSIILIKNEDKIHRVLII